MPPTLVERRRCSRKRSSTNLPKNGMRLRTGWFMRLFLQLEDLIGGARKDARKRESQLKRGHVAVALNGVDTLPRDTRGLGQLLLGQTAGDTQLFHTICDFGRHVKQTLHLSVDR